MATPIRIQIDGMTCASCVARVEKAISSVDDVEEVAVNLSTETATVVGPNSVLDAVTQAIERTGFDVVDASVPRPSLVERRTAEVTSWTRRVIVGAICSVPVMAVHWASIEHAIGWPVSFAFSFVALIFAGTPYMTSAWAAAKGGGANMDTLVSLGALVSFIYSVIVVGIHYAGGPMPGAVYFDATVMILTLISVGKLLEVKAKLRAASVFQSLSLSVSGEAEILRDDEWTKVDVRKIEHGDRVRVPSGKTIPVDGVVLEGESAIDRSVVTGESIPERAVEGDAVTAGTMVIDGLAIFEATAVGAETTVAKIQEAVESLQDQKAAVQTQLADRVAAVFVPAIIVLSIITVAIWLATGADFATAIGPGIAVLVVACPCALGLATPVAVMVASARASQRGILIRDVSVFERTRSLGAIAFDKTGTLTDRAFEVDDEHTDREALVLAAAVEQGTTHPVADAIRLAVDEALPDVSELETVPGEGVRGTIDGARIAVGKPSFVGDEDPVLPGYTIVSVTRDSKLVGRIAMHGEVRAEAIDVVAYLREKGLQSWIVSGDRPGAVMEVAQRLGIDPSHTRAGVAPSEKEAIVKEIARTTDAPVAMVGDGINDGPALAAAAVGIAMGSGSDFAKSSAAITIVGDSLWRIVDSIELGRRTHRTIIENLAWAFAYNIVLIPIAAFGFLSPVYASGAMALSSVSVVANSLRIRLAERPAET